MPINELANKVNKAGSKANNNVFKKKSVTCGGVRSWTFEGRECVINRAHGTKDENMFTTRTSQLELSLQSDSCSTRYKGLQSDEEVRHFVARVIG